MSWFVYEISSKRIQQLALFGAISHVLLGMSCIIIIIMYNSIFWIFYLAASAPNYAVSVLLMHGITHKNQRSVKLWIVYNLLQILLCIILFCYNIYEYYTIEHPSKPPGTNDTRKLMDSVMVKKVKMGALLDAATAMIFILLLSTCCNMVLHYHEKMKMEKECGRKCVPQERKEAFLWLLIIKYNKNILWRRNKCIKHARLYHTYLGIIHTLDID